MRDILDECRAPIPYVNGYNGEYVDADAVRDTLDAAAAEIERLRAENAMLCERLKRWEPLADPNSVQSGKI